MSNGLSHSYFCQGIIHTDTGNKSINKEETNTLKKKKKKNPDKCCS